MRISDRLSVGIASLSLAALSVIAAPALSAAAAAPTGTLTIVNQVPNSTTSPFAFTLSPPSQTGATSLSIAGGGTASLVYAPTRALSITEAVPASFGSVTVSCLVNGSATGVASGASVTAVMISPNKVTTCTFTQTALPVTVVAALAFSPTYLAHLGSDTTETWSVTNPNAFPVKITALNDSRMGTLSAPTCAVGRTLAAGATCGGSLGLYLSQQPGGASTSTFTASLVSDAGATASVTKSATLTFLTQSAALRVTKAASPATLPKSGGWTTVTVTATNIGVTAITLGDFNDTALGLMDYSFACHAGTVLQPGTSCDFTSSWWYSSPTGASLTSTVWNIGRTSSGTWLLGEGASTVSFT